jgi:hypothetical protein
MCATYSRSYGSATAPRPQHSRHAGYRRRRRHRAQRRERLQTGSQPPLDRTRILTGQGGDLFDTHAGQSHERQRLTLPWWQTIEWRGRRPTADGQAHSLRDERTPRRSERGIAHDALGHVASGRLVGGRLARRPIDPREVLHNAHAAGTYGPRRCLPSTERMIVGRRRATIPGRTSVRDFRTVSGSWSLRTSGAVNRTARKAVAATMNRAERGSLLTLARSSGSPPAVVASLSCCNFATAQVPVGGEV